MAVSCGGIQVIIPPTYRKAFLEELHNSHSGIVRMKAVSSSLVWWPGIDQDIEKMVKTCNICMRSAANPDLQKLPYNHGHSLIDLGSDCLSITQVHSWVQ